MAGSYIRAKYETNDGEVRPIRVQPETVIAGFNPQGDGTLNGSYVRVSGSKRKFGLKARSVTLSRNVGPVVEGIQPKTTTTLPVFTKAAWTAAVPGTAVTYDGKPWEVASRGEEGGR